MEPVSNALLTSARCGAVENPFAIGTMVDADLRLSTSICLRWAARGTSQSPGRSSPVAASVSEFDHERDGPRCRSCVSVADKVRNSRCLQNSGDRRRLRNRYRCERPGPHLRYVPYDQVYRNGNATFHLSVHIEFHDGRLWAPLGVARGSIFHVALPEGTSSRAS
jgi:hypothetical protein